MPKNLHFPGPSFEEAAWSINEKKRAPFKMHVDSQFTKENKEKLAALRSYNSNTQVDFVDVSKIDATLKQAEQYSPMYDALLAFYYNLAKADIAMTDYFPYYIERKDGTFLTKGPSGLQKFVEVMNKVDELRSIHQNDDHVLQLYFHKGSASWKEGEINAAITRYRQRETRKRGKRRIEPTRKSPSSKRGRSKSPSSKRSRSKNPSPKRRRSTPAPRQRF